MAGAALKRLMAEYKRKKVASEVLNYFKVTFCLLLKRRSLGVSLGVKTRDFFLCFLPLLSYTMLHSIFSVPLVFFFNITPEFSWFLHRTRAKFRPI